MGIVNNSGMCVVHKVVCMGIVNNTGMCVVH